LSLFCNQKRLLFIDALYEECSDKEEKAVYMDINYTVRLSNRKHVNNPAVL